MPDALLAGDRLRDADGPGVALRVPGQVGGRVSLDLAMEPSGPGRGWGTSPDEFRWAVGIENTFVPQTRDGHRSLDEYELMGHYRLWKDDIDKAANLGVSTIRYGIPWYRVNPRPGVFDWSWTDPVLEHIVAARGLTPIIDLIHYGTPDWLEGHFVNPEYPSRVAEYAARFAERYGSLVHHYTPLNEPAVTARYCGRDGRWPPYLSGDRGYVEVLLALAEGVILTCKALRDSGDVAIFHVEDLGLERPASPESADLAASAQSARLLPLDLACGLVEPGHPGYAWLVEHGADEARLDRIHARTPKWDLLGVNFYPWTNQTVRLARDGTPRFVRDPDPAGLVEVIRLASSRYRLPLMVTETSSDGSHQDRARWMRETIGAVKLVRAEGLPVVGYTWFPFFTMVDWRYRWSRRGIDHHLLHLGLYDVPSASGAMDREETPLVDAYRAYLQDSSSSVGGCRGAVPARAGRGDRIMPDGHKRSRV